MVVGDNETGETGKYDGAYYLIHMLLSQPSWCSVTTSLPGGADSEPNVVPRDFVVGAIAHLSAREDTVGEVYQLCDPAPLSMPAFVDAVADAMSHRVVSVPGSKPLTKRLMEVAAARGIPAEPATLGYLDHPTRYACPNTRRALAGIGIEAPPFESCLDDLVAFVRENPDASDEATT